MEKCLSSSGFRVEGGGRPPPSVIRPLTFLKFWDIHFWLTDLKNFLKAPLAPKYGGGGVELTEKRDFLVEIFQKMPKNAFFRKFTWGAEHLVKLGSLYWFGRAQKINWLT